MPASFAERIRDFAARHRLLPRGARIGVAVSGGADSVCLLHVLDEITRELGVTLVVIHIDHQLRGEESSADARFVEALAEARGFAYHGFTASPALEPGNLEQAARQARLAVFHELVRSGMVDRIATGHTLSDQSETVFYRFIRGAGTAGIAGILPITEEGLIRPLLNVDRDEVRKYLAGAGIAWREDSSNQDPTFVRNRLRNDVLPRLAGEFNPGLAGTLAGMAEIAREEDRFWEHRAASLMRGQVKKDGEEGLVVPASAFTEQDLATARRLVRHCLKRVKGDLRQIDLPHVEGILGLAALTEGHGRLQVPGVDIIRSFEWLRFAPLRAVENRNWRVRIAEPAGEFGLPGGGRLRLRPAGPEEAGIEPAGGLAFRNWRPGDEIRRVGASRSEKLKVLFQESRIPLWERRNWPMLVAEAPDGTETLLWTRRFGWAEGVVAGPDRAYRIALDDLSDIL